MSALPQPAPTAARLFGLGLRVVDVHHFGSLRNKSARMREGFCVRAQLLSQCRTEGFRASGGRGERPLKMLDRHRAVCCDEGYSARAR